VRSDIGSRKGVILPGGKKILSRIDKKKKNHSEKRHGINEERDPARRKANYLKKRQEKEKAQ
jgi:hypothetical protein